MKHTDTLMSYRDLKNKNNARKQIAWESTGATTAASGENKPDGDKHERYTLNRNPQAQERQEIQRLTVIREEKFCKVSDAV